MLFRWRAVAANASPKLAIILQLYIDGSPQHFLRPLSPSFIAFFYSSWLQDSLRDSLQSFGWMSCSGAPAVQLPDARLCRYVCFSGVASKLTWTRPRPRPRRAPCRGHGSVVRAARCAATATLERELVASPRPDGGETVAWSQDGASASADTRRNDDVARALALAAEAAEARAPPCAPRGPSRAARRARRLTRARPRSWPTPSRSSTERRRACPCWRAASSMRVWTGCRASLSPP